MKNNKVSDPKDLASRIAWKQITARSWLSLDNIIDLRDVLRHRDEACNEAPDDLVIMPFEVEDRVRAVFLPAGFPMPTMWHELRANLLYLEDLHCKHKTVTRGLDDIPGAGERFLKRTAPHLIRPIAALANGGVEGLAAFHRKQNTFEKNAKAYREWTDADNWYTSSGEWLLAPELVEGFKPSRPIRTLVRGPKKKTASNTRLEADQITSA